MRRHQYFRHGIPITEADALVNGVLRDGCTVRVPAFFRDSAAATHHRVTDAGGGGNRPGFRVAASDAHLTDEVARARAAYLDYITNAYKEPQRDQDTRAGEPGLVGHNEPPDRHRFDGMTVDEISRCHQQNMRRIYDEVACELSEAWRQR